VHGSTILANPICATYAVFLHRRQPLQKQCRTRMHSFNSFLTISSSQPALPSSQALMLFVCRLNPQHDGCCTPLCFTWCVLCVLCVRLCVCLLCVRLCVFAVCQAVCVFAVCQAVCVCCVSGCVCVFAVCQAVCVCCLCTSSNPSKINSNLHQFFFLHQKGSGHQTGSGQPHMYRVGQNHIYTVYIRYIWQGFYQIYGHIRCIHTVLAGHICILCLVCRVGQNRIYTP